MKWLNSVGIGIILIRRNPSTSMVVQTNGYWESLYGIEKGLALILTFHIAGRVKTGEQYEAYPYK